MFQLIKGVIMKASLYNKIQSRYFQEDEDGVARSGHPDTLAISMQTVLRDFPGASRIPVIQDTSTEGQDRSGYMLGSGIWLFPGDRHFTSI